MAVAAQCFQVARRLRQVEDAHRTGDFGQQARHRVQDRVVPVGFDEGDEGIADFGEIGRGLARQRAHHLARFLRQLVVAVARGIARSQAGDLVIE